MLNIVEVLKLSTVQWLEEAVLSYKARKKLPKSAFCGPNRSYPAHDRKHAANCLARAAQNKAKLGANYNKIVACCRRKLKKFGGGKSTEETVGDETVEWFLNNRGMN